MGLKLLLIFVALVQAFAIPQYLDYHVPNTRYGVPTESNEENNVIHKDCLHPPQEESQNNFKPTEVPRKPWKVYGVPEVVTSATNFQPTQPPSSYGPPTEKPDCNENSQEINKNPTTKSPIEEYFYELSFKSKKNSTKLKPPRTSYGVPILPSEPCKDDTNNNESGNTDNQQFVFPSDNNDAWNSKPKQPEAKRPQKPANTYGLPIETTTNTLKTPNEKISFPTEQPQTPTKFKPTTPSSVYQPPTEKSNFNPTIQESTSKPPCDEVTSSNAVSFIPTTTKQPNFGSGISGANSEQFGSRSNETSPSFIGNQNGNSANGNSGLNFGTSETSNLEQNSNLPSFPTSRPGTTVLSPNGGGDFGQVDDAQIKQQQKDFEALREWFSSHNFPSSSGLNEATKQQNNFASAIQALLPFAYYDTKIKYPSNYQHGNGFEAQQNYEANVQTANFVPILVPIDAIQPVGPNLQYPAVNLRSSSLMEDIGQAEENQAPKHWFFHGIPKPYCVNRTDMNTRAVLKHFPWLFHEIHRLPNCTNTRTGLLGKQAPPEPQKTFNWIDLNSKKEDEEEDAIQDLPRLAILMQRAFHLPRFLRSPWLKK